MYESTSSGLAGGSLRNRSRERGGHARALVLAAGLVLAGFGSAAGASGPDPLAAGLDPRARLDALIERVKEAQAAATSLRAEFVQKKVSELFIRPEVSRGVFVYSSPDRVRWEYREPVPIVVVIRGEEMVSYYPDLGRADEYEIGQYSEQVFKYLGATGSLETLKKYFSVEAEFPETRGEDFHLLLTPKYPRIKRRLEGMELWVDGVSFLPRRLLYLEPGGDTTDLRFETLEVNPALDPTAFELELPAGTTVKRIEIRSGD